MKTKIRTKFINLFVVLLVLTGNVLQGTTPVFAADATGVVASAATASNTAPEIGMQITVTVSIDTSGVTSTGDGALGSYTGTLAWNPSILAYDSYSDAPPTGFAGAVNIGNVGIGTITFNGANASGATDNIVVLVVTFNVIGAGDAGLDLAFSAMAAALTFEDLLPLLEGNITETDVTVPGEPVGVVTLDGDASSHSQASFDTGNTVSFDHTTGTGINGLLLVGISLNANNRVVDTVSVTFTPDDTGEPLALGQVVWREGYSRRYAGIFSLLDPPSGKEGVITVTFTFSSGTGDFAGIVVGAANFAGVDQTTPLGTANSSGPTSTVSSISVDVTTTGNELVFDTVWAGGQSTTPQWTISAGSNQDELWNFGLVTNTEAGASTKEASVGTTTTMTWTRTNTGYMILTAVPVNPAPGGEPPSCYALTLTKSGLSGSEPTADLANSPGCPAGQYVEGQVIGLTAYPDWGYEVQSWTGTDNNSSTELTNVVTMPDAARTVNVNYQSKPCYDLVLTSGENGGNPTADPSSSQACTLGGTFVEGEVITLTASPDSGYRVASWSGTDDDDSKALTNTLTMSGAPGAVHVEYEAIPCYLLTLTSGDHGDDPTADPIKSSICTSDGYYVEGEEIDLTADPDTGYRVASWSGTDDDESKALTNTLTMPAEPGAVNVTYEEIPPQVMLDGAVSSTTADDVSVVSFNHTTGTGDNRLMLVGASWNCNQTDRTINTVTFTPSGGSAIGLSEVITQLGYDASHPRYSAVWASIDELTGGVVELPAGAAGTVTITFSGSVSNGIMAGAANFSGVDQADPLGAPAGLNGNSLTPSVNLTGLNGTELVFDNVFLGASSTSYALTAGEKQTRLWHPDYIANLRAAASIEQATGSSVTMSWDAGTANYWAVAAVPINPAVGEVTGTIIIEKQTIPDGHEQTFEFTGDVTGTIGDGGQIVVNDLVAGTYQVQEVVPLGWVLSSIVCDGFNSTPDLANKKVTITLAAGETGTCVFTNILPLDFGDAPDTYQTLLASDGARHFVDGPVLGYLVDDEWDGLPTALADGDDNDWASDEDGVSFPTAAPLTIGANAQVGVVLSQPGGKLDAWIDFNGNGSFDHPSEHLWSGESQDFSSPPFASPTTYFLDFSVPASAVAGISYARFRLSTAGGLQPYGYASDGEVEDYRVEILEPESYTVTFNANGGSGTMAAQTASSPTALTQNTFTKTGYSFAGWNTIAAGGGTAYADEEIYDFSADMTLYAQWTANTYTVTFDANDGDTPDPTEKTVTYDSAYGTLATTSRTGYTFAGWYTAATDGTQVTAASTVTTASDHVLYAHWTANTYTVTFDANGGSAPSVSTKQVTYDTAYGDLATVGNPGYTFAGWFTAASGGTLVTAETIVATADDHTLYAHWSDLPTVTVTADTGQTKVYGQDDPTEFTYTSDPVVTFTGALSRVAGEDAGTYAITQGDLAATGYTIIFNSADFTITPKAASVTPDAASKIYGDADPTFTGVLAGFLTADDVTADYTRVDGETVAGSPYTIIAVLSPAGVLGNYDITYNTADFTITKKAASVTPNAASKIYGDTEPTLTGALTGFLPADAVTADYARAAGETVAGSPYLISATLSPAGVLGNYNITYNTANFTITIRSITVTADDKSKFVGEVDPPLTYTVTEGSLAFSDTFTGALARISGELVGTYAITRGNLALNANYNMTFIEGTLTISEIPTVTVTVDGGQTKVYGQSDPIFTYQSSDSGVEFTGALNREAGEDVDTYAITQGTLAADGYVINFVPADFTITAKPITVTADAQTKVYGDVDPDLTYQYTPALITGDSFSGALERADGENIGTYAISQGTLTLGDNYNITFTGANLTITTRPITVTADDKIKNQGTVDPPLTYTITSGSLAFTDAFTGALARVAGEDIGDYAILQGNLALNANYNMTFVEGTLTIIAGTEHQIDLVAGWNLVSFNLTPSDPDIEVVLEEIMEGVDLVYAWNGETGSWLRFDPDVGFGNTLEELDEAMGFWINMDAAATLTVVGTEPTTTDIPLYTGWNLIGYPADAGDDLPGALDGISGNYNLVMAYHAADTSDPWKLYEPDVPDWVTDLDQLDPGWGYWIDMTEGATLSIDFE